jgi:hypothetical protein
MPSSDRHLRRIEAPTGSGTIHHSHDLVSAVTYGLWVLQERAGTPGETGAGAVQAQRQILGGFTVTSGSLPFEGDQLTLRLSDGRRLPCFVVGDGPSYTIDAIGGFH